LLTSPLDAAKKPLDAETVEELYPQRDGITLAAGASAAETKERLLRFVAGVIQK
jgi:hypothetical protein